jgi:hypothetical protein
MSKLFILFIFIFTITLSCYGENDMYRLVKFYEHSIKNENTTLSFFNSKNTKSVIIMRTSEELIIKSYKSIDTFSWDHISSFSFNDYDKNSISLKLEVFNNSGSDDKEIFEIDIGLMSYGDLVKLQNKYQDKILFSKNKRVRL